LEQSTVLAEFAQKSILEKLRLEEEAKQLAKEKEILESLVKIAEAAEAKAKLEKEQFEKEKAEFEENKRIEKQKTEFQLKVDNRISQLTDLELKFDFQSTFVGFDFFIDILDIKTYDDKKWNTLISKIEEVKSTPLPETPSSEPTVIADGYSTSETPQPKKVEVPEILAPVETTASVCYDLAKEITWDSIEKDFKNSGEKSYSKWLKNNYNVPTKL